MLEVAHSLLEAINKAELLVIDVELQHFTKLSKEFTSSAKEAPLDASTHKRRQALLDEFSTHQIVIIEAAKKVKSLLETNATSNVDPVYQTMVVIEAPLISGVEALCEVLFFFGVSIPKAIEEEDRPWWHPTYKNPVFQETLVSIYEGGQAKNVELVSKLATLLPLVGETLNAISKAYWIDNPLLLALFEGTLESMGLKHTINPTEFNKKVWRYTKESKRKVEFMAKLERLLELSSEVFGSQGRGLVLPMVQGTSENSGHRIAKNGFGTVSSLDPGWYGQGIYFTSKMSYAGNYAARSKDGIVFLISLVIPGNSFPITEPPLAKKTSGSRINPNGFLGRPCQPGYQSHYTVVDVDRASFGKPVKDSPTELSGDELVVFEPSHTLPLFLVYSSELYQGTLKVDESQRPEWVFE